MVTAMTDCQLINLNSDEVEWSGTAIYVVNLDAYGGKISLDEIDQTGIPTGAHYLLLLDKQNNEIN